MSIYNLRIKICIMTILTPFVVKAFLDQGEEIEIMKEVQDTAQMPVFQMRCTRRFTPGMCSEQVKPVWTFSFQKQNCTERLGCLTATRTNRFRTYSICKRRCSSVLHLYSIIIHDFDYDVGSGVPESVIENMKNIGDVNSREMSESYRRMLEQMMDNQKEDEQVFEPSLDQPMEYRDPEMEMMFLPDIDDVTDRSIVNNSFV